MTMIGPDSILTSLPGPNSPSCWLQVGTLFDGVSSSPIRDAHIVFDAEKILYIGKQPPTSQLIGTQASPNLQLTNHTLLPGLIEAHAHLFLEGGELDAIKRKAYLGKSATELLALAILRLEKLLKLGIIAYRDAGDKDGVGIALSKLYRSPSHPAMPYIDSPGAAIHHAGRYGTFMSEPAENFPTPAAAVADRVASGVNRIKLIPTGIINFKKGIVTAKPQMTLDELKGFVAAAKANNMQTFAHASGDLGIELALEARVDSIEHGFFIREDQLAKLRDYNIAWVPTFTPVQIQVDEADRMGWDSTIVSKLKRILEGHAESLAKAQQIGVKVIAGSDAGSYGVAHGLGFLYELELMEKAGLSTTEVINSATGVSASHLRFSEDFGILRAGAKPRFLLSEHKICESVSNLRQRKLCYFDGSCFVPSEKMNISGL